MPVTRCAVIYSISPRGVMEHCCIVPEHDDAEMAQISPPDGHGILYVDCVDNGRRMGAPALADRQQMIAKVSGLPLADMACAVIDGNGRIVNVIAADMAHPAHKIEGHTLVNHPLAKQGDTWDGAHLSRRFVSVDQNGTVTGEVVAPIDDLDFTKPVGPQLSARSQATAKPAAADSGSPGSVTPVTQPTGDGEAWLAEPDVPVGDTVSVGEGDWLA